MIGIDDFKRLPCHSSQHLERIGNEANAWVEAANAKYKDISRIADMQELVSKSAVDRCWDDVAAIRQIDAAVAELLSHFELTIAKGTFEFAQNQVTEALRKAIRDTKLLAMCVER